MNQRVMIAMAIACNPRLLIADEPTTALDVTIQAQILDLLLQLQRERGMALVLITHNMGVVAETAQRVVGDVCRPGDGGAARATHCSPQPQHPYTAALLAALPERSDGGAAPRDHPRRGARPVRPAAGCLFAPRCAYATRIRWPCAPTLRAVAGRPGALPLSAGRSARAQRASRATAAAWRVEAARMSASSSRRSDLRAVYPDPPRPVRARRRMLQAVAASRSRSRRARRWRWSANRAAASRRWRAWSR